MEREAPVEEARVAAAATEEEVEGEEAESGSEEAGDAVEGLRPEDEAEAQLAWHLSAPMHYDLYVDCHLTWPALSVSWLPDEPNEPCRLALGLHTDGSEPHEVVVTELACSYLSELEQLPWDRWSMPGLGEAVGFGCAAAEGRGPLRVVARLEHPTEVNRVLPCPSRPQLLATKAATGAVLLFDYKAERPARGVSPDAMLLPPGGASADGFALAWGPAAQRQQLLATGGNDGRLCAWDVEAAAARARAPLLDAAGAHSEVCAVAFERLAEPATLASVGSDGQLCLWDLRTGARSSSAGLSSHELLAVDWSFHEERLLATSGKQGTVQVWDLRAPRAPRHTLKGHSGEVVAVKWAQFQAGVLATCSSDSKLLLWDLSLTAADEAEAAAAAAEGVSPELLFSHTGHSAAVSDLAWSDVDDFLLCSVSEAQDCKLQIWQPAAELLAADGKDEGDAAASAGGGEAAGSAGEPAPKRPRHAAATEGGGA